MATVDNKEIIDELIANNGEYSDDPPVKYIVSYETMEGKTTWGICYSEQDLINYLDSPFCENQKMIFRRK